VNSLIQLYKNSFSGLSKEIWALSIVTLINRSGTIVILFLSIYLISELNFTMSEAGTIMSFFGIGSLAGVFIGGKLTDSIGFYKVQLWSLILTGLMFFILVYFKTFWSLSIGIFFTSFLGDMFRPANLTAVGQYSSSENRTRSISLIRLAINIGFTAGPALGGILAYSIGYNWLFILDGSTCLLAALFFFFVLPKVSKPNKQEKIGDLNSHLVENPMKNRRFLFFITAVLINALAFWQLFTTVPYYLKSHYGLPESQIGLLLAMNGLMIAIIEMPLIYKIENKFNKMKLISLGSFLVALSFFVYCFGSTWIIIPVLSFSFITIGEIIIFPFTNSWAMDQSTEYNRGRYMSYYGMAFSTAHIIAPPLGMKLAEMYGFNVMWTVIAGIATLSSIIFYLIHKY
jgi:predicted MFS family arabinose efflux permease